MLFGMLHLPDDKVKKKDTAIVLLSPGVKMRVAPHRLYIKMADFLVKLGYPVIRFDFYGSGDAEGEIELDLVADYYGSVAVGRYIDDTVSAIDWIEQHLQLNKVLLGGLCGGALTGLLSCDDARVVGVLGLGIPVNRYSANIDKSKYITQGQLTQLRSGYIKKLFQPKSWLRLLTFQSDFRVLAKSLLQPLKKKKKNPKTEPATAESNQESSDYNSLFGDAFFKLVESQRKIIIIYSGADRLAWEFDEKFRDVYQQKLEQYKSYYELHNIEHANHILSDRTWQEEMQKIATTWLNQHYAG